MARHILFIGSISPDLIKEHWNQHAFLCILSKFIYLVILNPESKASKSSLKLAPDFK